VRKLRYRYQRTITRAAEVSGVGFLTGATVRLRFLPAPPGTGIVFVRTDLRPPIPIPARVENVTGTNRRTTLGRPPNHVGLAEHVLASLAGLRIDNCVVQLNAPEPPGLDGSAQCFADILRDAGTVLQPARRSVWSATSPLTLCRHGATLKVYPGEDHLRISYLIDYGLCSPIARQLHTQVITPESFASDIAGCRTFILESEAAELRRQGLGARTTTTDLLVFGPHGPIDNQLRYANEPARHKVLDLLGDLSLFGHDLRGHLVAYRSGHPLNVELAGLLTRKIGAGPTAASILRLAA
jgi:UDP-3-O-acyl N-acetylglucosamine deacetylase